MKTKAIFMLAAVLALSLFVVGCSSDSYDYNAPPGNAPTGGGCGVGAPTAVNTDSAEQVVSAVSTKTA